MTVLVFGSVIADLVFQLPELPRPGHTVLGTGLQALPGGKGANQACAAARDGARVAFAGAVGEDALAPIATAALRGNGVDTTLLRQVPGSSGCAAVCVDAEGHNQIAVAPGANLQARAAQVPDTALSPATILLLQMEVPPAENAALIARARAAGARILLNLAPPLPGDALRALDLLIANEHEAAVLAQGLGCGADAAALRVALGIDIAITLGPAGAIAATAEGLLQAPGFPVRAVDTTGAGDCWSGVLAAALDRGLPMDQAMRRANAAAALSCQSAGAAPSYPDSAAIEALLSR